MAGCTRKGMRFEVEDLRDPKKRAQTVKGLLELRHTAMKALPTKTHGLIYMLREGGQLQRCYTQNFDMLEHKAGLSTDIRKSNVDCVCLHGSLRHLRCPLCCATFDWSKHEQSNCAGSDLPCPDCSKKCEERKKQGKRSITIGHLRPDIVFSGEGHPQGEDVEELIERDIAACPDLFLIIGASLTHSGPLKLARKFARAVGAQGGNVVYVNLSEPSPSRWRSLVDYVVLWECDSWVRDLESRKPKADIKDGACKRFWSGNVGNTPDNPIVLG
ncbi:NAD-dependent histone deacetylase HST3 [Tolypocladium ophioglossoides CBS 100239]|uniref:NAD-dependent histone deacetylase HST3 n=1 Tax=Tolypocladium ophioglossoides (strain CBS 100239) TaxID=1163406 RepID=A0A0L0N2M3_TOLOC|nr:NAD-dependent histone deacetylase HST3 [Tolypocladium ophioglossoides CBS 100239]